MNDTRNSLAMPAHAGTETKARTAENTHTNVLQGLAEYLRGRRVRLQEVWVRKIRVSGFLAGMTSEDILTEFGSLYNHCIGAMETGSFSPLQAYAHDLSERIIPRGAATHEVIGVVLLLKDVLLRSLLSRYGKDLAIMKRVLDVYEPVINQVTTTVAEEFVKEHMNVIGQQRQSIRELSTPVLSVRDGLLILPIIGMLDTQRTRQMMEQLLLGVRTHRANMAAIDLTGVPDIDAPVANHLVHAVEAARLIGAEVIVTGLSPALARTLVTLGVDLSKMTTVGDLQGGIEKAEKLLGYTVLPGNERRARDA